jgi:hypothetical protein
MTTFRREDRKQIDPVTKTLLWFAGVDVKVLQSMERPVEVSKYVALGIMTLIACLFAGGSAFVFMASINIPNFHGIEGDYIKFTVSSMWSIFVFAMDRFLLTSFKKKEFNAKKLFDIQLITSLVLRITLCFVIASFIATEIELTIFSSEISIELARENSEAIESLRNKFNTKIKDAPDVKRISEKIKSQEIQIAAKESDIRAAEKEYTDEADGKGGSGKRGIDKLTLLKKGLWEQAKKELNSLKIQIKSSEQELAKIILSYKSTYDLEVKEIQDEKNTLKGSLVRKDALESYINSHPASRFHFFKINLILTLVELGPIVFKVISPYSNYDKALRHEDRRRSRLDSISNRKGELLDEQIINQDKDIDSDKLKFIYDAEKSAITKINGEIDKFSEDFKVSYIEEISEITSKKNQTEPINKKDYGSIIFTIVFTALTGTKDFFVGTVKSSYTLILAIIAALHKK